MVILILDNLSKHASNKQCSHPISIKILYECLLWCLSLPLEISNAIVNSDSTLSDQAWMISCRPNRVAIISFTLAKVNPIICYSVQFLKVSSVCFIGCFQIIHYWWFFSCKSLTIYSSHTIYNEILLNFIKGKEFKSFLWYMRYKN